MLAVAVGRAWRVQPVVVGMVATIVLLRCHPRPIDVPGRAGGVEWVLAPVVPSALAALMPSIVRRAHMPLERTSGRFELVGRLVVAAAAWVACVVPVAVGVGELRLVDVRNAALLTGLALVAVACAPPALAWAPSLALGVVTWLIGVPPPGAAPPEWAVLLASRGSSAAMAVSVAVAISGVVAFAVGSLVDTSDGGLT
jgi:hypothetical protein